MTITLKNITNAQQVQEILDDILEAQFGDYKLDDGSYTLYDCETTYVVKIDGDAITVGAL